MQNSLSGSRWSASFAIYRGVDGFLFVPRRHWPCIVLELETRRDPWDTRQNFSIILSNILAKTAENMAGCLFQLRT